MCHFRGLPLLYNVYGPGQESGEALFREASALVPGLTGQEPRRPDLLPVVPKGDAPAAELVHQHLLAAAGGAPEQICARHLPWPHAHERDAREDRPNAQ